MERSATPETFGSSASQVPPLISLEDEQPTLAPDFTLIAQSGEPLTLSQLRGRPVVLTFLYAHCMTTCPLYSLSIHEALGSLGDQQDQVTVVTVTVDPERDTVEDLKQYTQNMGWAANWFFVSGDPAAVDTVLDSYRIAASQRELSPEMKAMGMQGYEVVHRAVVFVLDQRGYVARVLRNDEWTPEELADAIEAVF